MASLLIQDAIGIGGDLLAIPQACQHFDLPGTMPTQTNLPQHISFTLFEVDRRELALP